MRQPGFPVWNPQAGNAELAQSAQTIARAHVDVCSRSGFLSEHRLRGVRDIQTDHDGRRRTALHVPSSEGRRGPRGRSRPRCAR